MLKSLFYSSFLVIRARFFIYKGEIKNCIFFVGFSFFFISLVHSNNKNYTYEN